MMIRVVFVRVRAGKKWPSSLFSAPRSRRRKKRFVIGERPIRLGDTRASLQGFVARLHLHSTDTTADAFAFVVVLEEARCGSTASLST